MPDFDHIPRQTRRGWHRVADGLIEGLEPDWIAGLIDKAVVADLRTNFVPVQKALRSLTEQDQDAWSVEAVDSCLGDLPSGWAMGPGREFVRIAQEIAHEEAAVEGLWRRGIDVLRQEFLERSYRAIFLNQCVAPVEPTIDMNRHSSLADFAALADLSFGAVRFDRIAEAMGRANTSKALRVQRSGLAGRSKRASATKDLLHVPL